MKYIKSSLLLSVLIIILCSFRPSPRQLKSVIKSFEKDLKNGNVELAEVDSTNSVYSLTIDSTNVAKVYFRELTPRSETFSYMVAIAPDSTILKLQILDYPSPYGLQITKPQWSKKLVGLHPKDISIGKNVDAITGATLTTKALTNDLISLVQ